MRFSSKRDLLEQIERTHRELVELVDSIPRSHYRRTGVWGDGWSLQDLLAHLTEWEQMFLGWYRTGRDGARPPLPAPGYKWSQTPELNRAIWLRHRRKPLTRVLDDFQTSYREILILVRELPAQELLTPGRFAWTGKNPLTTYLAPNTCSHYRAATKILKRWLRGAVRERQGQ